MWPIKTIYYVGVAVALVFIVLLFRDKNDIEDTALCMSVQVLTPATDKELLSSCVRIFTDPVVFRDPAREDQAYMKVKDVEFGKDQFFDLHETLRQLVPTFKSEVPSFEQWWEKLPYFDKNKN
jgi:hypothetical protein